mmetsp:Transcript_21009/g.53186  ORF Transcript_21009/g.53186 Transcript_21009/m.53186 type:complete len:214 (-) Transcript_21009:1202-1843(-)
MSRPIISFGIHPLTLIGTGMFLPLRSKLTDFTSTVTSLFVRMIVGSLTPRSSSIKVFMPVRMSASVRSFDSDAILPFLSEPVFHSPYKRHSSRSSCADSTKLAAICRTVLTTPLSPCMFSSFLVNWPRQTCMPATKSSPLLTSSTNFGWSPSLTPGFSLQRVMLTSGFLICGTGSKSPITMPFFLNISLRETSQKHTLSFRKLHLRHRSAKGG